MSMHEYEEMVEDAAHLLKAARGRDPEHRCRIMHALYGWQDCYDTGVTYGRVMPWLLEIGYCAAVTRTGALEAETDYVPHCFNTAHRSGGRSAR